MGLKRAKWAKEYHDNMDPNTISGAEALNDDVFDAVNVSFNSIYLTDLAGQVPEGDITGTGSEQEIDNLMGVVPTIFLGGISAGDCTSAPITLTFGTSTETKLKLTLTSGAKVRYFALI